MYIDSIRLFHFRNFHEETISFSPSLNLIIGKNGQGKTNLVEAINLLGTARSFRTSNVAELVEWGEKDASIFGMVKGKDTDFELGLSIVGGKRIPYVNDKKADSVADFLGRLLCVSFSPTDLALVKGSPQGRRRFMDKHIVDLEPKLMRQILDYSKALRNKNALLKDHGVSAEMVRTWNGILAELAVDLTFARIEFLKRLEARARKYEETLSLTDGELTLQLKTNVGDADTLTVEKTKERYESYLERELRYKTSLIGPHRDDMIIALKGRRALAFASQGQARSIVLSLKLAVIDLLEEFRQESPIILLDDVDSELDSGRRETLSHMISTEGRQVFITGTEERFSFNAGAKRARVMSVSNGKTELLSESA